MLAISSSADSEESRRMTAESRSIPNSSSCEFSASVIPSVYSTRISPVARSHRLISQVTLSNIPTEGVPGPGITGFCLKKERGIVAAVDVPEGPVECINVRQHQCDVAVATRYGMDPVVQTIYNLQHVLFLTHLQLHGSGGGGHQKGSRNALSRYISNHYLDRVLIDGYAVVVIAAHTSHRLHHAGDLQPGDGWATDRQKHPLYPRG